MDDQHVDGGNRFYRRTLLQGVAAAGVPLGFGHLQDEGEAGEGEAGGGAPGDEPVPRIRMVIPQLDVLTPEFVDRLVIVSTKEQVEADRLGSALLECLPREDADRLVAYEAVVVDWEGALRRPSRLRRRDFDRVVETRVYLPVRADVDLGSPWVIVGGYRCGVDEVDREFLSVTAHKLTRELRDGQVPPSYVEEAEEEDEETTTREGG